MSDIQRNDHHSESDDEARVLRFPTPPAETNDTTSTTGDAVHNDNNGEASVVDGEVVEQTMVDLPDADRQSRNPLIVRDGKRRPILPVWMRSKEQFRHAVRHQFGFIAHASAYHALRCPVYVARILARIPQGALRLAVGVTRWVMDAEGLPLRWAAARREDGEQYLKLSRQRDMRVRARTFLLATGTAAGIAAVIIGTEILPTVAQWAAVTAAAVGLGMWGAPADKPIASRAVVPTKVAKLTSDVVIRALASLGIGEINKAMTKGGTGITFPKPITRDGPGWRADVDLPYGVTVTDIVDRRDKLASGLRRPLGCVWPEPDGTEHAGRLVLWVGDQDMSQTKPATWPLAARGEVDLFNPVPFGTDQRGRPVSILLMFANVLIGAMPRFGKTFALRVLALAAALDPRAELHVFELKGSGDLSALQRVAHRYGSGFDDATIAACLDGLEEVLKDLERRSATIAKLPKHLAPESKVTPQLAGRMDLRLHPLVVVIDECQNLFTHPDFGKRAGELATQIIKLGPAFGVILLLATQRPDAKSLPTGVSANVGIRLCLRVMGQQENDMVLGTSSYQNGIRATMFTVKDKGIGYLVGNADEPQIVRSALIDNPAAETIAERAYALRDAAGTLSGYALGDTGRPDAHADTVLDDLVAVIAPDEAKVWTETALQRLAQQWPDRYGSWEPDQLSAVLKSFGVKTNRQVWGSDDHGEGRNRRGFHRGDLTEAITERNRRRDAG